MAEELLLISTRLRQMALETSTETPVQAPAEPSAPNVATVRSPPNRSHLNTARKAYALRRKRSAIFGNPDLFGEPAWDILLDLYIANGDNKPVSVSSACIGSAAPATTGLRWLAVLADEGLILRESDPLDQRRVLVRLSSAGLAAMNRFFDTLESSS